MIGIKEYIEAAGYEYQVAEAPKEIVGSRLVQAVLSKMIVYAFNLFKNYQFAH
jgi:hypothetical protein